LFIIYNPSPTLLPTLLPTLREKGEKNVILGFPMDFKYPISNDE
jgi:hypothetical protein